MDMFAQTKDCKNTSKTNPFALRVIQIKREFQCIYSDLQCEYAYEASGASRKEPI